MAKKGGEFEEIAIDFLEKIFTEIGYTVVRKRIQNSGTQDGYDNAIEVVDEKYRSYLIYAECKDYTTELNYTDAFIKLPQLASTHEKIDLALFISPKENFKNIFEETKNQPFLEAMASNKFNVAFLSPETMVEEYFSLYGDLYKKVYLNNAPAIEEEDRKTILKKFERFIFSDRNLRKIVITDSDKTKYIAELEKNKFHINRTVRASQGKVIYSFESNSKTNLKDTLIDSAKGLILLGGAGYGKSSELKDLAISLWLERDKLNIIPFFTVLKNFNTTVKIEDILPADYKYIQNLYVIFDGIDEVENIVDFTNKLKTFIRQNKEHIEKYELKFLISCRTNVYKKYIKEIESFDICFLNEVDFGSAVAFLLKKFNLDLNNQNNFEYYRHRQLFENPFYLDLIGEYYKTNKVLLTNRSKLIDAYVNLRLDDDYRKKYPNDITFDRDKIKSFNQKIAFALETTQKSNLLSNEIKRIVNVDESTLSKNPFLEQDLNDIWGFENKNLQEYFVAQILVNLSFDEILSSIRIDAETNKIHPTWYNVVSFLLNLNLPQDKYDRLIEWLVANDYEVLFSADADRISNNIKSQVLQNYFIKNCEEETLWVNDITQIASFSESDDNIKYLISKTSDATIHRRARMSAIKILSYMEIPAIFHNKIKKITIEILQASENNEGDIYLKQDIIQLTSSIGLNSDVVFFNEILSQVAEDDHKEIVSAILRTVPILSVESNLDYFLEVLEKAIGEKEWKFKAKYKTTMSTKEQLFSLFIKIVNPDSLIRILQVLIERHNNYSIQENLIENFLKHIESIFKTLIDYHPTLIGLITDVIINNKIRYNEDDLLAELAKACNIDDQIFTNIIVSIDGNSHAKHFLVDILQEKHFKDVVDRYKSNLLNDDFIREFRNVISHKDFQLSKSFEDTIEAFTDYKFPDKITFEELEENKNYWRVRDQENFDVLFNLDELNNQIIKIYKYIGVEELSYMEADEFYDNYYKDLDLQKTVTVSAKQILFDILKTSFNYPFKLKLENVFEELNKYKMYIMEDILNSLPENTNRINVTVSKFQIDFIKSWCLSQTEVINENYLNHISINSNSWNSEIYFLFELVYKFQKRYNFDLDEATLLNMLWFNLLENEINLDFISDKVSLERINERIIYNLINLDLHPSSYCNYVIYCNENDIDLKQIPIDFKKKIYDFLNSDNYYLGINLIENLYSNDTATLTEFLSFQGKNRNRKYLLESVYKSLNELGKEAIFLEFVLSNEKELIQNDVFTQFELIKFLIMMNHSSSFERLLDLIINDLKTSEYIELEIRQEHYQKFTNPYAICDLIKIFELHLITPNSENIFDKFSNPVRIASDILLNICKNQNANICFEILEKLNKIDFDKIRSINGDLFYYHKLKNDVMEIYYKHKSMPYSLEEAIRLLKEKDYLFVN